MKKHSSAPPQSTMMIALYGTEIAPIVYARCQALGQHFNERVQGYVYDQVWRNPSITLPEKSLITIVALAASQKAEQLKIHLWGMFHQGTSHEKSVALLTYMHEKNYNDSNKSLAILNQSYEEYKSILGEKLITPSTPIAITQREKALIDFVAHMVKGNNDSTKICLQELMKNENLSIEDMKHILSHVAVYCGFPVEMNGLAILNEIQQAMHSTLT